MTAAKVNGMGFSVKQAVRRVVSQSGSERPKFPQSRICRQYTHYFGIAVIRQKLTLFVASARQRCNTWSWIDLETESGQPDYRVP